jgi:hypothetical protein
MVGGASPINGLHPLRSVFGRKLARIACFHTKITAGILRDYRSK